MIPLDLWRVLLARAEMYNRDGNPDLYAPCSCCCHEHTFRLCLARTWGGCRSGLQYGDVEFDVDTDSNQQ